MKGGAAAQLYLPVDSQRASVDLDILSLAPPEELRAALKALEATLGPRPPYFVFEPYKPREPEVLLPMDTFFVVVPSVTGRTIQSSDGRQPGQRLKLDILYQPDLPVPVQRVRKAKTFAFALAFELLCPSPGALFGDKLLTFAIGSVGVPPRRQGDLQKHFYDLDRLSRALGSEKAMADALVAMETLFEREAKVRRKKASLKTGFDQIERTLDRFARLDLREGEETLKREYNNFKSLYLRRPHHLPLYRLAGMALRLRFLVGCLRKKREQGEPALKALRRADRLESVLAFQEVPREEAGRRRRELGQALLARLEAFTKQSWRELRTSPPERVFWQLVSIGGLEVAEDMLSSNRAK